MKSKIIGIFIIAILIAMISVTSAASVNLVHKDGPPDWNEIDSAGLLEYSMPCSGEVMTYTFTVIEPGTMLANTPYSLVFYSRTEEGTWKPDTVWTNQSTSLIDSGTTDGDGNLVLSGTFDFSTHGQGLEYIDDGKDYDGSVKGAKVWLVPSANYDGSSTLSWNPTAFLFERDLVSCTGSNTQIVNVLIDSPVGFELSPLSYNYGNVFPNECSETNPDGNQPITLTNTGNVALQIQTITTGMFENIDYAEITNSWIDANSFSIVVDGGLYKDIDTRMCIPSNAIPGNYGGTVTFEYIAVSL